MSDEFRVPATCTECGGTSLTWDHTINTLSGVQDGRLRASEMRCQFFLGCDYCSATLMVTSADKVAAFLTGLAQPSDGALTNEGAEPFGRVINHLKDSFEVGDWAGPMPKIGTELFTHPAPAAPATCTCQSGDGSLRWPCQVHPPEVKVVMSFDFEHPLSKQRLTVHLTKQDVYDGMEDYFYDKLGEQICQCESVGETNVVDCNCDEYVHDFELVADNACLDRVKDLNS